MNNQLTVRKALEVAVRTERLGAVFYNKLAEKFKDDGEIRDIFATLAQDEIGHFKQFNQLLASIPEDEDAARNEALAFATLLAQSAFFIGEDGLDRNLGEIKTREDALEKALQFEKDTWGFYVAAKDAIGRSTALEAIIEAEQRHMAKLISYLITGAKMRGLDDEVPPSNASGS
ncbi:MAG: ferritin family protein [Myxococcota bacterium]|nr:ferritin family protein [Myxococcota bacterium]